VKNKKKTHSTATIKQHNFLFNICYRQEMQQTQIYKMTKTDF